MSAICLDHNQSVHVGFAKSLGGKRQVSNGNAFLCGKSIHMSVDALYCTLTVTIRNITSYLSADIRIADQILSLWSLYSRLFSMLVLARVNQKKREVSLLFAQVSLLLHLSTGFVSNKRTVWIYFTVLFLIRSKKSV